MRSETMWKFYELAGIPIRVEANRDEVWEDEGILSAFQTTESENCHMFRCRITECLTEPAGDCISRMPERRVYRNGDQVVVFFGPVSQDLRAAETRLVRQGDQTEIEFRKRSDGMKLHPKQFLNAMDLPHLMAINNGFLLHASYIGHEGKAILFTAPCETGKSTQAQLWCDHAGAELVNGDRAAVRIIDGEVFACGTPFSGSSPVRRNVTLPLAAIVYLSQAPENSITRLRGVRAFRRVWEGCTVNGWERADVELATKTVSEVVSRIPVYHLACTPDARAVELLKHTMEVEK